MRTIFYKRYQVYAYLRFLPRRCYQCQRPFLKVEGCNHIRCNACKAEMCYICKKPIQVGTVPRQRILEDPRKKGKMLSSIIPNPFNKRRRWTADGSHHCLVIFQVLPETGFLVTYEDDKFPHFLQDLNFLCSTGIV
jgi:hypothetical protein